MPQFPDESIFDAAKHDRRFMVIDLEAADLNPDRGKFEAELKRLVDATASSSDPDRYRSLWKSIVLKAEKRFPWSAPSMKVRRVTMAPARNSDLRRATRVLSMIHELHKAGYQLVRATPALNGSGMHWRCHITSADNVMDNGYTFRRFDLDDGTVAGYSSSQGDRFFDWPDAPGSNARELAEMFLTRFPIIAERGMGRDWMYAGWLSDLLGHFEQAKEDSWVYLEADFHVDPDMLRLWRPPPPPVAKSAD